MMIPRPRERAMLRALFAASALALALALAAGAALAAAPALVAAPALAQTGAAEPAASDRFSVEVIGAGPDIILIPGYASGREVWRAEAARLSATHRVHMIQLAGFAGEPWTHGDGALLEPVVEAVIDYARRLDRPAIIGHSMGGLTALRVAQDAPQAVDRILIVDSLPFYGALFGPQATVDAVRPQAMLLARGISASSNEDFAAAQVATADGMSRNPAARARIVQDALASDRQALATAIVEVMTADARAGLAAMTTPVTAIYAADADGGAPAAMADAVWGDAYAPLPNVQLIRVDGSRHFIMDDQPERFAEIVDRFLAAGISRLR